MLNLDEASSQEEPIDPCEQLKDDILYELHDQSRDQFQYKCSNCHIDTESGYHCRECNVSTLIVYVCVLMLTMLIISGSKFAELPPSEEFKFHS